MTNPFNIHETAYTHHDFTYIGNLIHNSRQGRYRIAALSPRPSFPPVLLSSSFPPSIPSSPSNISLLLTSALLSPSHQLQ
ncbi:hypothetical protein E2C01_046670 [Portunus trituberculatus]|uniref:Uncharacterized protein n=1 Tax=Portunus trituberculatus TaxID=210409 RepID=A0A5B7G1L1_PORTR|nr:hypothetical protein [Portunus trituberculatus]